mmetsp:Transcript_41087/g.133713  ORF Transcript_41087/g.133713 Transcript_41087/m.133713 type:complete len:391 (+) Transcript_41087:109-1281(+)
MHLRCAPRPGSRSSIFRPRQRRRSVHLLNVRAAAAAAAAGHAAGHAAHVAARALRVHRLHDGRADALDLLLLVRELLLLGELVALEPLERLLDGVEALLLVLLRDLVLDLVVLERVLHRVAVVLEPVLRLHLLLELLVLLGVLLRVGRHLLDVLLGEARLVVGDGDLVLLAGRLLERRHVEHAVRVDVERHVDLRHAARHGRDARQVELAQLVVVLGARALALEDLDGDGGLVVRVGGEGLRLLRRHGRVARDEHRHHLARRLEAERERRHVEQQQVLRLCRASAREDGSLHGGAVRDRLVGVDRLGRLLAVEEVGEERDDLGDASRAAHQDDVVHLALGHLRVAEALFDGLHGGAEEVHAELLEAGARDGGEEVDALEERVDLDGGLRR